MQKFDTKIINFFGGAGVGKTAAATNIFSFLKENGREVEYAPEVAKDLVWDGAYSTLQDVVFMLGQAHNRVYKLVNQVEYIICDGPFLLHLPYVWYENRLDKYIEKDRYEIRSYLEKIIVVLAKQPNNINFYIQRDTNLPYFPAGRVETLEQAMVVDAQIKHNFHNFNIPYTLCTTQNAVQVVKEYLTR